MNQTHCRSESQSDEESAVSNPDRKPTPHEFLDQYPSLCLCGEGFPKSKRGDRSRPNDQMLNAKCCS